MEHNLLNRKFSKLTVIAKSDRVNKRLAWLCKCECGKEKIIKERNLINGNSKSCGCSRQLNLLNKKFTNLTVIAKADKINELTAWLCKCKCGKEVIIRTSGLINKKTRSCGCIRQLNLLNKCFHNLTVISKTEINNKPAWLCKCKCGKEKITTAGALIGNKIKSCGCLAKGDLPKNVAIRAIWRKTYKDGDIDLDQFIKLSQQNCHYCNSAPNNKTYNYNKKEYKQLKYKHEIFIYNGLDRIDSSKKHTMDNVVPCCKICNYAKRDNSYNDYIEWIKKIHDHFTNIKKITTN